MKNIFITGNPGIGKTTIIRKVIQLCNNLKIRGFYTSEIRENGIRKGFKINTILGKEGILAHVDINSKNRVGKYGVNLKDINTCCVTEIEDMKNAELTVIDEIGKMEVFSGQFCSAVEKSLDSKIPVIGTISKKGGGFIGKIRCRPDVKIIDVNFKNRNSIPFELIQTIKSFTGKNE